MSQLLWVPAGDELLEGHSLLKKRQLQFVLKMYQAARRYRPALDRLGLSCVFDDGSHPRPEIAVVRTVVLDQPAALPFAVQAIAILPRVRETLAPRAQVKTREHPHQNTRAAMGLGQLRLYFFPEVCRGASCARASICACLACNTVNALGATLRTKPDSQRLARPLRTENSELITEGINSSNQHNRTLKTRGN